MAFNKIFLGIDFCDFPEIFTKSRKFQGNKLSSTTKVTQVEKFQRGENLAQKWNFLRQISKYCAKRLKIPQTYACAKLNPRRNFST